MLHEKKQQAKELFFQTDLSKTQIANLLGISRRSLHYWVKDEHWDRLRQSATQLPALLAEKCYHIFGHLTDQYLSELRATKPISHKEADTLHKLVITINKLKNRSTLNENIETFSYFLDGLKQQSPELAQQITPYIDKYLTGRASIFTSQLAPAHYNAQGLIPVPDTDYTEQQLDTRDLFDWDNEQMDANPDLYPTRYMAIPDEPIPSNNTTQQTNPTPPNETPKSETTIINTSQPANPETHETAEHPTATNSANLFNPANPDSDNIPTATNSVNPANSVNSDSDNVQRSCTTAQESSKNPTLQKT